MIAFWGKGNIFRNLRMKALGNIIQLTWTYLFPIVWSFLNPFCLTPPAVLPPQTLLEDIGPYVKEWRRVFHNIGNYILVKESYIWEEAETSSLNKQCPLIFHLIKKSFLNFPISKNKGVFLHSHKITLRMLVIGWVI